MNSAGKVDVAINVYGKPYQTAVTLWSLMKYSGHRIHKIFLSFEKKQPNGETLEELKKLLNGLPIEYFTPTYYLWIDNYFDGLKNKIKWFFPSFRHSFRYQYAWEKSNANYLLIIHNDVIFKDDLVSYYVDQLNNSSIGVGRVGQCWNCPAFQVKCTPESYWNFRPSMQELIELYKGFKVDRALTQGMVKEGKESWPLPECRLNELVALINLKMAKPLTFPKGSVPPFGVYNNLDLGIEWFKGVSKKGFKVKHVNFEPYAIHAWANDGKYGGHNALSDADLYESEEALARKIFESTNY